MLPVVSSALDNAAAGDLNTSTAAPAVSDSHFPHSHVSDPAPDVESDVRPDVRPEVGGAILASALTVPTCQCGECPVSDVSKPSTRDTAVITVKQEAVASTAPRITRTAIQRKPLALCCMSVVDNPRHREVGGLVCKASEYTSIIATAPTKELYNRYKDRLSPAASSFEECSNPAKRLIIYALLHARLAQHGGWQSMPELKQDKQKPMPVCLAAAVRKRWPG